MNERPDWAKWGMTMAFAVATRADCSRRKVGAVILDPAHRVVATGYNGAAPGEVGCLAGGCPRASSGVPAGSSYDTGPGACIAIHAEANALLQAARWEMAGSVMYITADPCDGCLRLLRSTPLRGWVTPTGTTVNPSYTKDPA